MNDALQRVRAWMEEQQMLPIGGLPIGGKIVVGLSGGADSIAMTDLLVRLFGKEPILCAHVNHGIRGEEADGVEQFVKEWCRERGLALEILQADVPAEAQKTGEGLEACGRRIRYAFFEKLAAKEGDRIATAHTMSDQGETLLLHLLQGTGLRGLCGIPPVRGKIIRPVLCLTREEIESYCREQGLCWRTDSTNACRAYTRNRLRLDVMPVFRELNPNIEQTLHRTAVSLAKEESFLEEQAQMLFQKAQKEGALLLQPLCEAPDALAIRALELYFKNAGCQRPEWVHLQTVLRAVRNGGGRVNIPSGFEVSVWRDRLEIAPVDREPGGWKCPVLGEKTRMGDGRTLFLEDFPIEEMKKRIKFHNLLFPNLMDYDTITSSQKKMVIRTRQPGDRFAPAGRGVTKSLKKLFSEARIPPSRREKLAVLELDGEILWVEGFGISQRVRLRPETRHVLLLQIEEAIQADDTPYKILTEGEPSGFSGKA